jgi:archaellum biogenesis protein FlaJ (TadC family)
MRIEIVPLIAAAIVGLIGLGLIFDAWTADEIIVKRERRRRTRVERSRGGEASIGFGVLCMAAAFAGRDTWRYSVVAVIAGTALLLIGAIKNRQYFSAALSNRGALRRRPESMPAENGAEVEPTAKPNHRT